jgi:transcriptional regulator GlxA family with amidase domain
LIHGSLEKNWSVLELATTVGMSRSAFSARFSELIGQSPIQYLTRWRMQTAARLLSEARLQMNDVAARVGYDSEAAFSKAFKREMGINPSVYRQSGVRD